MECSIGNTSLIDAPLVLPRIPASVVCSSSSSVAGHMVYPGGHTVMYATPTSSLADGSLTVLNTFPPAGSAQSHDPGEEPRTQCSHSTLVFRGTAVEQRCLRGWTSWSSGLVTVLWCVCWSNLLSLLCLCSVSSAGLPHFSSSSRSSDSSVCRPASPGNTASADTTSAYATACSSLTCSDRLSVCLCVCVSDGDQSTEWQQ